MLFLYLKMSLKIVDISTYKNEYKYYMVDENNDTILYGPQQHNINELKYQLSQQCENMVKLLEQQLDKF